MTEEERLRMERLTKALADKAKAQQRQRPDVE
jgi:hypothetical protein